MQESLGRQGWRSLLKWEWIPTLAILLGGVLLQSMNVLMLTTVLPSIVRELGGVAMLSWPTTAFLASSIVATSCAGMLAGAVGARVTYCAGVTIFGLGALACSLATTMDWIVIGRLVQGFGGGLEAAAAYVAVRVTLPEAVWSRTIALMSSSWSVSVLIGPLVGGTFARFGNWRGAFFATAFMASALAIGAFFTLPSTTSAVRTPTPRLPAVRIALICVAIAVLSSTSIVVSAVAKVGLIAAAVVSLSVMLRLDRVAPSPLLSSDAFSVRTQTGVGLWLALLLCVTYSPLQIYVPIFLQQLHGLDPLAAGFAVASASLGWTVASLLTAGAMGPWQDRLILSGPAMMGLSLTAIALLTPRPGTLVLIAAIVFLGVGIGQCWPFVAHRIMVSAKAGDETVAASSVPTVQQMGFALGAALAGLAANVSGLSSALQDEGTVRAAAFWVPASFVVSAALAFLAALRLRQMPRTEARLAAQGDRPREEID